MLTPVCRKRYLCELETLQRKYGAPTFIADSAISDYKHDEKWFKLITDHILRGSTDGYGIITVGIDHTENHPMSIYSLLKERGYKCHIVNLAEGL